MSLVRLGINWTVIHSRQRAMREMRLKVFSRHVLFPIPARRMCELSRRCWKCGSEEVLIFCHSCNTLQQPSDRSNFFEVIGINPSYDLDTSELTRKYRQLQNILHPDRFANKSEEERLLSEDYSSLLNKAYSTLQQPLSRGLYMLEMQGHQIGESTQHSDPEFLMEIMELNESVEAASSPAELNALEEQNKKKLQELSRDLSSSFATGDLEKAKHIIVKMKYYATADSKIKEKRQESGFAEEI